MKDLKQELEALSTSLNELKEAMNLSLNLMSSRIEEALKEAEVEPEEQKPTVRMVPFDLEKAKQGAKLVTRDGSDARIICYDCKAEAYPIAALVFSPDDNEEEIVSYTKNGTYYDDGDESFYDLMIEEECV